MSAGVGGEVSAWFRNLVLTVVSPYCMLIECQRRGLILDHHTGAQAVKNITGSRLSGSDRVIASARTAALVTRISRGQVIRCKQAHSGSALL